MRFPTVYNVVTVEPEVVLNPHREPTGQAAQFNYEY